MKLELIKTKSQGVFVKDKESKQFDYRDLSKYFFDGHKPKPSFNRHWFIVSEVPKKIQIEKSQPDINHRYELIDPELESDKFPVSFKRENVAYYAPNEYSWFFKEEFEHLRSLYKLVSDPQPKIKEDVEFEIVAQIKIDEVEEYKGFSFPALKTQYASDGDKKITESDAQHQLLDRITFPDLILPSRPCKLTSKQTFDIIRKHVLNNINGKWARVTSDHNFCFTVKKVIPLKEQKKHTVDVNLFSKRKPKYVTQYQNDRKVDIFEMTHSEANYKGYTPIQPFMGDNEEELGKNIQAYLDNLMEHINKPLKDCPHCEGKGVIIEDLVTYKK